jgi:hypothetical protein
MTYAITTKSAFLELASTGEQQEVITFLNDAIANDNLVSIQASLVNGEEVYLYGMYDNTAEWVSDYNSNGGLWEYSNPAKLLKNFTDADKEQLLTFFDVSDNLEWVDAPAYFYGNFDHLQETIKNARKAMIDLNADRLQFYYRAELINDEVFLNSTDIHDVFNIHDGDISWLAPEVAVSIYDTKVIWKDKHDNSNQMWITVERDYDTKFQSIHDRALNNSSTLA